MLFNKYLVLMKTVASEEIYKEGPTKVGDVVCETYERTDRQTDRQTDAEIDTLIAIIRSAAGTRAISHRTTKHFGLDRLCRLRASFSTAN